MQPLYVQRDDGSRNSVTRFLSKIVFPELVIGPRFFLYDSAVTDSCPAADTGGKLVTCINDADKQRYIFSVTFLKIVKAKFTIKRHKNIRLDLLTIFFYSLYVPSNFLKPFHFLKNFKNNLSHKKVSYRVFFILIIWYLPFCIMAS
jgi:hypothetical protein